MYFLFLFIFLESAGLVFVTYFIVTSEIRDGQFADLFVLWQAEDVSSIGCIVCNASGAIIVSLYGYNYFLFLIWINLTAGTPSTRAGDGSLLQQPAVAADSAVRRRLRPSDGDGPHDAHPVAGRPRSTAGRHLVDR